MLEDYKETEEMRERLARIEVSQTHFVKQLDRVIQLLDRMARAEEHANEQQRSVARIFTRLEIVEKELETWRSARRVMVWVASLVSVAAGAAITVFNHGGST